MLSVPVRSESRSESLRSPLVDIAAVVAASAAGWFLEDGLRRLSVISMDESSRGFLAVVTGAIVAVIINSARGGSLADLGFRRPKRWLTVPLWIIAIFSSYMIAQAVVPWVVSQFLYLPQPDLSRYDHYHGNASALIAFVLILPFTASIPEEIVYRGFIMGRLIAVFGEHSAGRCLSVIVQSLIFGAVHFQWGPGGVLMTTLMGAVWGTAYLLCGRNLWIMILTHSTGHILLALQLYQTPPAV